MVAAGEDDLICDFAQTYHVYDWRGLPLKTAAALAAGLPDDSRTRRRMYGVRDYPTALLLGEIIDLLRWLRWAQTEDGTKGKNRPDSMVEFLTTPAEKKTPRGFRSAEEFEAAYARFIIEGDE